ncbi:surface glycoprotein [Natronolimnohabitans sp. A-GB9]|uniref:BGTF surface domain-containing protein n=1 Tax=Natronolimnohabitans sp. A-GB9 TaxID=3069757 RepID=UPI0027B394FB|nr:BGTF surface domain-containing protein [Natronolimnohabitans sp. A-GB9]MDQ2049344.1 surface glycoprotein [Natronolimnohabitans sp. A-GB9]
MTDNTTYREKGRAVFLAALMVMSVVAMSAAFAGGAAATAPADPDDDGPTVSDPAELDPVWAGQVVTINDAHEDVDLEGVSGIEVHEGLSSSDTDSDTRETTLRIEENETTGLHEAELDTTELKIDEPYHLVADESTGLDEVEFWVEEEDLDVEFDSSTVNEDDEDAVVEFESDRDEQWVNVTADDLDYDELEELFENEFDNIEVDDDDDVVSLLVGDDQYEGDDEFEFDAEFTNADIDTGEYEFTFNVTDSFAEDTASVTVTDDDADWEFVDVDSVSEGDIANITFTAEESDEATLVLGDADDGYVSAVSVYDLDELDDDEVVVQFNAHTSTWVLPDDYDDAEISDEYIPEDADENLLDGDDTESLPAYNWDLSVGELESTEDVDAQAYFDDAWDADEEEFEWETEGDRDRLVVGDRADFSDVNVYTAPEDESVSDFEDYQEAMEDGLITETSEIADDDGVFIEVEDFGADGMIDELAEYDVDELYDEEGIVVELEGDDDGPFDDEYTWATNNSVDDHGDEELALSLVTDDEDDYEGNLIFEVTEGITEDDTDSIEGTFIVNYNSDYVDEDDDDDIELEFAYDLNEREVEWDDSADQIEAVDGATVTGTTTVAPGTELPADIDSPSDEGGFVDTTDAVVEANEDGNNVFTAEFDLGDEQSGVYADLLVEDSLDEDDDEIETLLVDGDEPVDDDEGLDVNVDVDDIEEGETAEFDTTVTNNDADEVTTTVELEIAGSVYDADLTVDGDDSATVTFEVDGLDADSYDWKVTADDATDEGTLTVTEKDDGDDDAPVDDDDDAADDDAADDDDDDEADDDGTPGFGVAVAISALIGAAMLALRRQN